MDPSDGTGRLPSGGTILTLTRAAAERWHHRQGSLDMLRTRREREPYPYPYPYPEP